MKRVIVSISIIFIIAVAGIRLIKGSCQTSTPIIHDGNGGVGGILGLTCPTCFPRYWCLSIGNTNNNGANILWFGQTYSSNWKYNGDWHASGVNGCCGMWEPGNESRTMMASVEDNYNEGSANHYARYETEACERSTTDPQGFFFTRPTNWDMRQIPIFAIGTYSSSGMGGITTIMLSSWGIGNGPAHYWAKLQSNTIGTDLTLNSLCTSGGTSPCPQPIIGYQIRAITTGCIDGICNDPAPARPTTGLASNWNMTVNNGLITPRVPTFPITNIQIQNPTSCTPLNRYIFLAMQLAYADGYKSAYVSRNIAASELTGAPIDWCNPLAPSEAGKQIPMRCFKSSTSIICSFSNGGNCTVDNSIYYGYLSNVNTYQYYDQLCQLGNTGMVTFSLPDNNWFWVIASNNGTQEGSYGKDSSGNERPPATSIGACGNQQVLNGGC